MGNMGGFSVKIWEIWEDFFKYGRKYGKYGNYGNYIETGLPAKIIMNGPMQWFIKRCLKLYPFKYSFKLTGVSKIWLQFIQMSRIIGNNRTLISAH